MGGPSPWEGIYEVLTGSQFASERKNCSRRARTAPSFPVSGILSCLVVPPSITHRGSYQNTAITGAMPLNLKNHELNKAVHPSLPFLPLSRPYFLLVFGQLD